ncbi:MAG: hypothetical protein JNJ80_24360 [Gemmatimonadetes bacterium]|nr:hypothetical protein [Gemmatimonadota bacterium]
MRTDKQQQTTLLGTVYLNKTATAPTPNGANANGATWAFVISAAIATAPVLAAPTVTPQDDAVATSRVDPVRSKGVDAPLDPVTDVETAFAGDLESFVAPWAPVASVKVEAKFGVIEPPAWDE